MATFIAWCWLYQVLAWRNSGVSAAVVSYGKGIQKDVLALEENIGKYSHLFCAPEALVGSK